MKRHSYTISLEFDSVEIDEVIIDQHYRLKHPDVNDRIILNLIKAIQGLNYNKKSVEDPYVYYLFQPVFYNQRPYRLILLTEKNCSYLGVINAFRIQEKKDGVS